MFETVDTEGHIACLFFFLVPLFPRINSYKDYPKEEKNGTTVAVLRNGGQRERIAERDVLVGDIVFLEPGTIIPAGMIPLTKGK